MVRPLEAEPERRILPNVSICGSDGRGHLYQRPQHLTLLDQSRVARAAEKWGIVVGIEDCDVNRGVVPKRRHSEIVDRDVQDVAAVPLPVDGPVDCDGSRHGVDGKR